MRWIVSFIVGLIWVSGVQAQSLWLGASAGTSWDYTAGRNGKDRFVHNSQVMPGIFAAFPLSEDTNFRLGAADIRHTFTWVNQDVPARLRAYTVGVDYFLAGTFGDAVFSGGIGSYEARPDWHSFRGYEKPKFGYYLGVGEWFELSRRSRITAEIALHHTENFGHPSVITFNLGLSFGF